MQEFDLKLRRAQGKIAKQRIWSIFGENRDIDIATVPEDVWASGGVYSGFPTGTAETLEVLSASANDAAAGTGARTVKISGLLDANFVEIDPITVTLNGTTPVLVSATTMKRCSKIEVLTAGSGGSNAGIITVRHTTTTGNIFAAVPVGANISSGCVYTVPSGKTLYVSRVFAQLARASGAAGSAGITIRTRKINEVFQAVRDPEITSSQSFELYDPNYFLELPAKTDIKVSVDSMSDDNSIVYSEMSGVLVTDET